MSVKRSVRGALTRPEPADQPLPAPIAVSLEDLAQVAAGTAEAAGGSGGTRTTGYQAPPEKLLTDKI